jgi:hypothetical protein
VTSPGVATSRAKIAKTAMKIAENATVSWWRRSRRDSRVKATTATAATTTLSTLAHSSPWAALRCWPQSMWIPAAS